MSYREIELLLEKLANPQNATHMQRFFKTGPGQYGEGDRFLGIKIPELRKLAAEFKSLPLDDCRSLLQSEFHEERMLALFLLIRHYKKGNPDTKTTIYKMYMDNTRYIDNWDLVDSSAMHIVGHYLKDKDHEILIQMARAGDLWQRRIAVIATFTYIKASSYDTALKIIEILVNDPHDLIQKATGWMLREIGKRDLQTEEDFLDAHAATMPRTMLRYAIEKFPPEKRKHYLSKKK